MTNGLFNLNDLQATTVERIPTGLRRLDQVLGRGFVRKSLTLFAGHAGAGKSSLLTLISGRIASAGRKVLYVSSEEDLSQFSLRARRLGTRFRPARSSCLRQCCLSEHIGQIQLGGLCVAQAGLELIA